MTDEPSSLDTLAAAYEAFFAEAAQGGFGPPPAGEWTAEQIVAHVALNDDGLAVVCRRLLDGETDLHHDNEAAIDPARLDALVSSQSLDELIAHGRLHSAQLREVLGRLDEQQLATEVHLRFRDGDRVALDRPVPWGQLLLQIQPAFHLSGHTTQLRQLRA